MSTPKRAALFSVLLVCLSATVFAAGSGESASSDSPAQDTIVVVDVQGREITVPANPEYLICSGSGCLRLLTYLQAQDRVVAVDTAEERNSVIDPRPYALANPQFDKLPIFGEIRGQDNPELIVSLDPQPQLILKTYPASGTDPSELQAKTGIPVVGFEFGNLADGRDTFYGTLRSMGSIVDASERAEEVIAYIDALIADLDERTADIAEEDRVRCFVGGIAYRGAHGIQSTEPTYPPFAFVNADNVVYDASKSASELSHTDVAKEQILEWDPEVIFIDAVTIQCDPQSNAMYELGHDPVFSGLSAVASGDVYCLLPYNWYTQNIGSILADAYFVGSVLYPERFSDIDPVEKADEIYEFLVGGKVYAEMKDMFSGIVFEKVQF